LIEVDQKRWICYTVSMKTLDWYLKWSATVIVCAGALAASLNIYPLGALLLNLGSLLWLIVGVMWRERSLIAVNAVVLVIYTVGLAVKLL
jgi:hypothetical protein